MKKNSINKFCMHDLSHCLAPYLFRTFARGQRKKQKLDTLYRYPDGRTIQFVGIEPLDHLDMKVLQSLISKFHEEEHTIYLDRPAISDVGSKLLDLMKCNNTIGKKSAVIKTSLRSIATEIGHTSGAKNLKLISESLFRFATMTIHFKDQNYQYSCGMLAYYRDIKNDILFVSLNPIISETMLANGKHVRIYMNEVRQLKSPVSSILHQRLCARVDIGKTKEFRIQTLIEYVYPIISSDVVVRQYKKRIKFALAQIENTGVWNFKIDGDIVSVARKGIIKKLSA